MLPKVPTILIPLLVVCAMLIAPMKAFNPDGEQSHLTIGVKGYSNKQEKVYIARWPLPFPPPIRSMPPLSERKLSGSEMEGVHVIDIHDLVIPVTSKRDEKRSQFPLVRKIRRISCCADTNIYEPSIISFGPYHCNKAATLEMEKTKWKAFRCILGWNPVKKMRDYLEAIAGLEQQIRDCYADEIKIDSNEFLKMMLLDGCFILYLLFGSGEATQPVRNLNIPTPDEEVPMPEQIVCEPTTSINPGTSQQSDSSQSNSDVSFDDTYYSRQLYTTFLIQDLLLLENQVPFFVVVKIYELVTDRNSLIPHLLDTVSKFMEDVLLSYPKPNLNINRLKDLHHLLHLCHLYFKPNQIDVKSDSSLAISPETYNNYNEASNVIVGQQLLGWHQATEYQKAGVEFKKRELRIDDPHSLLDIGFYDRAVEIPCLTIEPNTYCLFQNLIAFEETCPQFGNHISTYAVFLSQFIRMPEDVSLLTKRGIIIHHLDSDAEVCEIFGMLAEGITLDFNGDYYLKDLCHAMEMHYQIRRPRWRETLGSIGTKFRGWARKSKPDQISTKSLPPEESCLMKELKGTSFLRGLRIY